MAELSDLLGVLMKNPQLISGALSALSASQEKPKEGEHPSEGGTETSAPQVLSEVSLPPQGPKQEAPSPFSSVSARPGMDKRKVLLEGVRPYLREKTCSRLDAAIALVGAMELFRGQSEKGD